MDNKGVSDRVYDLLQCAEQIVTLLKNKDEVEGELEELQAHQETLRKEIEDYKVFYAIDAWPSSIEQIFVSCYEKEKEIAALIKERRDIASEQISRQEKGTLLRKTYDASLHWGQGVFVDRTN